MSFLDVVWARDITERTVRMILIIGFGLVLLLLSAAGILAVGSTRQIQSDAEALVREEITIARLLNEVQAEEAVMTAALHYLVRHRSGATDERLMQELSAADESIARIARSAGNRDEMQWQGLQQNVREFTRTAGEQLGRAKRSDADLENLFTLHEGVIATVRKLVDASARRASEIDEVLAVRSRDLASESFGLLAACFLLSALCAGLTVRVAGNTIRSMEAQSAELSQVSWQMVRTQEETARRFSHELHDELGQSLAAIRANLTALRNIDLESRRADCIHLVDGAISNVRELSQLLRPVLLDDFGLDAALRWLCEKFSQRTGIDVEYQSTLSGRLVDETETHLFRIAQEALTNVGRHSGASKVSMKIEEVQGNVHFSIKDNGRGLAILEAERSPSLGMIGMRARARQSGGELKVSTPPGGGLTIDVIVPLVYTRDDTLAEAPNPAG